MIDLWGNEEKPLKREVDRIKRNWFNGFQSWSDREADDQSTSNGKCGYGEICDWCADSGKKKPCAKALKSMLRETGKKIDYEKADFCDVWNGDF